MRADAHAPGDARPLSPRFSLRFERGRGQLALSSPLRFAWGELRALEVDLGPVPRALDLTRGWRALRHRRGVLRAASVALDVGPWLSARLADVAGGSARAPTLDALTPAGQGLLCVLRGHGGPAIAFEALPLALGDELGVALARARAGTDGARPPLALALRALGVALPLDPARGLLRVPDALAAALSEALAPHAVRVPERAPHTRLEVRVEGPRWVLDARAHDAPRHADAEALRDAGLDRGAPSRDEAPRHAELQDALLREACRALAPTLAALAEDDLGRARASLEACRTSDVACLGLASLRAGLEPDAPLGPTAPDDPVRTSLELARALAARDVVRAARGARQLDACERAGAVAAEGLLAAADLARFADPATAADLVARAALRAPLEPRVLAEGGALLGGAPLRALLARLEAWAERAPTEDPTLWAALARAREADGADAAAAEAWARAVRARPDDPRALEGWARALAATDAPRPAVDAYARAGQGYRAQGRPDAALACALEAAALLSHLGEPRAALAALEPSEDEAVPSRLALRRLALVARLRGACGDVDGAAAAHEALVALADAWSEPDAGPLVDALVDAAARAPDAMARTLLAAARRVDPAHPAPRAAAAGLAERAVGEVERAASGARAGVARALAEPMRAAGALADAARVLARAGELDRDAALLRAAVELAERSGEAQAALEVLDRALAVLGPGPARDALARRRAERARAGG